MVTLVEWMHQCEINPDEGVCISIATDGLAAHKSNVIAVSCVSNTFPLTTLLVEGGNPYTTQKYHGIDPELYFSEASNVRTVEKQLKEIMDGMRFVILKDTSFFIPFCTYPPLRYLEEFVSFDVIFYMQLLDLMEHIRPSEAGTDLYDLNEYIQTRIGGKGFKAGYSFPTIYSRVTGKSADDYTYASVLEARASQLLELYNHILIL